MEPAPKRRGRPAKAPETPKIEPTATQVAIIENTAPKHELVLQGDPEVQLAFAMKAANALMTAVKQKAKPVMIRGEQYLEYGDWQTLARFFGATASVTWSKKLEDKDGKLLGYEARAEVLHNGQVISSAEAMCMKAERNWKDRDEFMLRSMAQTRAAAKALRNAYGWVAELAGMKATPAEEMDGVAREPMKPYTVGRAIPAADDEAGGAVIWDEVTDEGQILNREEIKEVQKQRIKDLLLSFGQEGLTKAEARAFVKEQTQLDLATDDWATIITRLEATLADTDPLANVLKQ